MTLNNNANGSTSVDSATPQESGMADGDCSSKYPAAIPHGIAVARSRQAPRGTSLVEDLISPKRGATTEPPRISRRPFKLSQAARAHSRCWRSYAASNSAGEMFQNPRPDPKRLAYPPTSGPAAPGRRQRHVADSIATLRFEIAGPSHADSRNAPAAVFGAGGYGTVVLA
jgi:hypothetical protein